MITGNFGCDVCTEFLGHGGGIYMLNAPGTSTVSSNLIANNMGNNSAWGQGGGILLENSDTELTYNTIEENRAGLSAGYGGGIAVLYGAPHIANNDILFNVAGTAVAGLGGGVFVWSDESAIIEDNLIQGNVAMNDTTGTEPFPGYGGGIYYAGSQP